MKFLLKKEIKKEIYNSEKKNLKQNNFFLILNKFFIFCMGGLGLRL
jgi:hypothetical protein